MVLKKQQYDSNGIKFDRLYNRSMFQDLKIRGDVFFLLASQLCVATATRVLDLLISSKESADLPVTACWTCLPLLISDLLFPILLYYTTY
jgi:hypothetical protein